jgi:hypothetical protein
MSHGSFSGIGARSAQRLDLSEKPRVREHGAIGNVRKNNRYTLRAEGLVIAACMVFSPGVKPLTPSWLMTS